MEANGSGLKVKEVTVSFGGTVNLGNYENFKIDLSVTWQPGTDTVNDAERLAPHMFAVVRGLVRDEVAKLESRNTRGWLRDTDLKAPPVVTLPAEVVEEYPPADFEDGEQRAMRQQAELEITGMMGDDDFDEDEDSDEDEDDS